MKKIITLFAAALLSTASVSAFAADKIERVGISVGALGNPFFSAMVQGIEKGVKDIVPGAKVTTVATDYDLNKQASQIETFIAGGMQIIFLNAADSQAIKPFVDKAIAAGIIVAAVDVTAAGSTLTVMTDNVQAGRIACEDLAKRIKGKGNFVIVNGPPVSAVVDRVKGCHETLSKYPNIKLLSDDQNGNGSREGAMAVMQGLLTRFPHIDAVFGENDPTSIGVDLAARQYNRKEMVISAVDGSPDLVDVMKKGDSRIVSSAAQNPYLMGEMAAKQAIQVFNGEKLQKNTTLIDASIVSVENVKSYVGWDSPR